eukprot:4302713-Pyramimonas_sp.AAC.1
MSPAHLPSGLWTPCVSAPPFLPPCTNVHLPVPTMSLSGFTSSVCMVSSLAAAERSSRLSR